MHNRGQLERVRAWCVHGYARVVQAYLRELHNMRVLRTCVRARVHAGVTGGGQIFNSTPPLSKERESVLAAEVAAGTRPKRSPSGTRRYWRARTATTSLLKNEVR